MIHNPTNIRTAGKPLNEAGKVMIMVHGRGSSAADILSLSTSIQDSDFAFVAPQAQNNTWYPQSFLRPIHENEPYLSSALEVMGSLRARLQADFNVKSSRFIGWVSHRGPVSCWNFWLVTPPGTGAFSV